MKCINRRIRRCSSHDTPGLQKESRTEGNFFNTELNQPFFAANRHRLTQNKGTDYMPGLFPQRVIHRGDFTNISLGQGTAQPAKIAYGNCEGVSVKGETEANYDHGNFSTVIKSQKKKDTCDDCSGDDCAEVKGAVVSVFKANPVVTLPSVPGGLNECEHNAVQRFISTTLSNHEQQHVTAFNTYNGKKKTPFTYSGCKEGFDAYIQNIHDNANLKREAAANKLSDALDPFNVPIPCNCPDPEPDAESEN